MINRPGSVITDVMPPRDKIPAIFHFGNSAMHSLLDVPRPKLARLKYGLAPAERRSQWEQWREAGFDGIEINIIGDAFGPTWPDETHELDFLEDFPGIKALRIHVSGLTSLEPLASVSDTLEWLDVGGWMKASKLSCQPIAKCLKLRSLSLDRLPKQLEAIETLTDLIELSFLGFTFKSLDVLQPLQNLQRLWIGFGSVPHIIPIGELRQLKALEIMRVRKLADLTPLSSVKTLQYLALGDMKKVEVMPDSSRLKSLRRVYLDTMNGVTDLSGLTNAPNLDELIVIDSKIDASVFAPIIESNIQRVTVGLASLKATAELDAKLGDRAVDVFGTKDEKIALI
ncbi:hypothetical protein OAG71_00680 [bacterium]|nr:hypothetical protein [bacterium]